MTQPYRNPENSWEVHNMLKDHPDRARLIQQSWTEESLDRHLKQEEHSYVVGPPDDTLDPLGLKRSVTDILRSTGKGTGDPEIDNILLDMERKGLIEALPDGQMLVKGTRDQLMEYGIDPDDKSIFDSPVAPTSVRSVVPNNPFGIKRTNAPVPERHQDASQDMIDKYMSEYSRKGYNGEDLVMVHGGPGESPMMFPRDVLAKARAHGEHLIEFTEAETRAWRAKEGDKASVRFVLDYDDKTTTSVTKDALDEAWLRNQGEIREAEDKITSLSGRISELDTKVASAAGQLLRATQDPETPGWTMAELVEHLKLEPSRTADIIERMIEAGHCEVFVRSNGEKAYRLNELGRSAYEQSKIFDENDPRLNSRQWFADLNTVNRRNR